MAIHNPLTDPRSIEKLINMLNLSGGKGALTPGGKDIGRDVRDSDCELEYSEANLVQAAAGLEQYILLDRPDIAYKRCNICRSPLSSCGFALSEFGVTCRKSEVGVEIPVSTAAEEEHRRVCGCGLCSQRDNVEVHVWSCGVLQESADRVFIHHAQCASTEQRRTGVLRDHDGLSAQLVQPGHFERIRVDGLVGRERWHLNRIAPRLRTTEAS